MIYSLFCVFILLQLQFQKQYTNNIVDIIIAFIFYTYFIIYSKCIKAICIEYCNINFIFFSQIEVIEKLKKLNIDVMKNNRECCSLYFDKLYINFLTLYFIISIFQLELYFYLCCPFILIFYTCLFFYKYNYSFVNTIIIYLSIIILQQIKETRIFNRYSGYIFCIVLFSIHSILYSINNIQTINIKIKEKYYSELKVINKNKYNKMVINMAIYMIVIFFILFSCYSFHNFLSIMYTLRNK